MSDDDYSRMRAAMVEYEKATRVWQEITQESIRRFIEKEWQQPEPDLRKARINGEHAAASDRLRIRAEGNQAFWSREATMYGIAAIAESVKPRQPIPPKQPPADQSWIQMDNARKGKPQ
jgi:hypothetical protein